MSYFSRLRPRHLPDFAAIWRNRTRDEKAKIHDEHLGAVEAYVDGLVEAELRDISSSAQRLPPTCSRVGDEVAHHSGLPVNAGYFKTVQARRPGACGDGAGLGDEDIALEAESLGARKIEHIGRAVQVGISAKAGWTFSVARNSSENANCEHGELERGRWAGGERKRRGAELRIRHRKRLARDRVMKEIGMAKERDCRWPIWTTNMSS